MDQLKTQSNLEILNYYKLDKMNSLEFGVEGSAILNKFDYVFEQWRDSYGNITPKLQG